MSSSTPQANEGQLGLFDAISIIVGIVIGASIFHIPNLVFSSSSDPWTSLGVWAFGGLLALIGALCYAELATTYPRQGSRDRVVNKLQGTVVDVQKGKAGWRTIRQLSGLPNFP